MPKGLFAIKDDTSIINGTLVGGPRSVTPLALTDHINRSVVNVGSHYKPISCQHVDVGTILYI